MENDLITMPSLKPHTQIPALMAANRRNALKSTALRLTALPVARRSGAVSDGGVVGRETGQPGMLLKTGELEMNGSYHELIIAFRARGARTCVFQVRGLSGDESRWKRLRRGDCQARVGATGLYT